MTDAKLYQYYEKQDVLPTFGHFRTPADLDAHQGARAVLFAEKLKLPPRLFRDLRVLEFGPDSGENAMAFAKWGANLTLVEPNPKALGQIRDYFERFGLGEKLKALIEADVEGFWSAEKYELVDAEGFIYTIQPQSRWLAVLQNMLESGGFAVVSYYERRGGFLELATRAIQSAGKAISGFAPRDCARELFQVKWDSIPHTRRIESWIMDVLENPFVRRATFLDAATLLSDAHDVGLSHYASWPSYSDGLQAYWHKRTLSPADRLVQDRAHIARSALSFLAGAKLYLTGSDAEVSEIAQSVDTLVDAADAAIDDPLGAALARLLERLESTERAVAGAAVLAQDPEAKAKVVRFLSALRKVLTAAQSRDFAALKHATSTDADFIGAWGLPAHFLVLQRRPA